MTHEGTAPSEMSKTPRRNRLHRGTIWLVRTAVQLAVIGATIALTLIFAAAFAARRMPELQAWHRQEPAGEFRASDASRVRSLADYLALEESLFTNLKRFDLPADQAGEKPWAGRFIADHRLNPTTHTPNWNRTTIIRPEGQEPKGVALLIHGCSDSPYSFKAIADALARQGWTSVCLRLPGHGTTPAGLLNARWRDWQAAVTLVARDLNSTIAKDRPFIVGGFSLGGALSLRLMLDSLDDPTLPRPDRVFLFSPAVGVGQAARLAQAALFPSRLAYFEKAAWLGIVPEFDPYKYNSFTKRAGFEVWAVAARNLADLTRLSDDGRLGELPPLTAFVSAIDTTVDNALLLRVIEKIPDNGSDVTIFDINRKPRLEPFFKKDPDIGRRLLASPQPLPFTFTLVTNTDADSLDITLRTRAANSTTIVDAPTTLAWPEGVLCLSHSAIPFAPTDEVYGSEEADGRAATESIGTMVVRSERGALALGAETLMRMRSNPFYSIVEDRLVSRLPERKR